MFVVIMTGCHTSEQLEEGGETMESQDLKTGTLLDERPEVTELATFGLG